MSAIPGLKKKLKSVRATGKLSKALKTVSAAKYARLSAFWKSYSLYAEQYRMLSAESGITADNATAVPETLIVLGSNRGFCGGFNHDVLKYYEQSVKDKGRPRHLIVCGEKLIRLFSDGGHTPDHALILDDVPTYASCDALFDLLTRLSGGQTDYAVRVIRPFYRNTMIQTPGEEILRMNPATHADSASERLWIPDRETVLADLRDRCFRTLLYGAVLETALGAQAATLMTMRAAFDTATAYTEALEREIHRLRQSEVTADVIETASERGSMGGDSHV